MRAMSCLPTFSRKVLGAAYIESLGTVVKAWIEEVARGRPYVFQQTLFPLTQPA